MESRTQGSRPRPRTQKKSEAKAKDSLSEDRHSRGQGQECSRSRTKDTSASALQKKKKKKVFTKIFQAISKKKKQTNFHKNTKKTKNQKGLHKNTKIFQAISTKKGFPKNFQALYKILTIQKIMLSSNRGQANFRGLEASRPRPRPRTSKSVLEDSTSDNNNIYFRLKTVHMKNTYTLHIHKKKLQKASSSKGTNIWYTSALELI